MQQWGSIAAFDDIIAHIREHEADIAKPQLNTMEALRRILML